MEFSLIKQSSPQTLPSPSGALLAVLSSSTSELHILALPTLHLDLSIALAPSLNLRDAWLRWSPSSSHLLLATPTTANIYKALSPRPLSIIQLPTSPSSSILTFSPSPTPALLIFTPPANTLTILHPPSSATINIPSSPKSSVPGIGYAFRPKTQHLALLTRPVTQDILSIHHPLNFSVLHSLVLPTLDAQSIAWSPSGTWIAVHDAAGPAGYKVVILTADGQVFRIYDGGTFTSGLGVRSLAWCTGYLAVGGDDGRITLLNDRTFSSTGVLQHKNVVTHSERTQVLEEHISLSNHHSYLPPSHTSSITLPQIRSGSSDARRAITTSPSITSISTLAFNSTATILASIAEAHPSTVWLWSIPNSVPTTSPFVVLVHRTAVKELSWHPHDPNLLLIHCAPDPDDPTVRLYLWRNHADSASSLPEILTVPELTASPGKKLRMQWLRTQTSTDPEARCFIDDGNHFVIAKTAHDQANPQDPTTHYKSSVEYNSIAKHDTIFDSSPSQPFPSSPRVEHSDIDLQEVEDTFRFRRARATH